MSVSERDANIGSGRQQPSFPRVPVLRTRSCGVRVAGAPRSSPRAALSEALHHVFRLLVVYDPATVAFMPPKRHVKRSFKRTVQQHRAELLAMQELAKRAAAGQQRREEEDPAGGGWRDSLETAAQCLMGTVAVGLSAYALRGLSSHLSRDAAFMAVSSAFCLCGVASNAAAFAGKPEADAPQVAPTAERTPGEEDWFSGLITELWPHIQEAAVAMKDEVMEPMIQQSVPSVSFQDFDLGEVAPKVSFREVRSRGASRGITMKMDVAWTSDSKISMTAHAVPFGLSLSLSL